MVVIYYGLSLINVLRVVVMVLFGEWDSVLI